MKKFTLLAFISFSLLPIYTVWAQEKPNIPVETLTDLSGNKVSNTILDNQDSPLIISFWATWCAPCLKELNSIKTQYAQWQKESGVKLIAISIDRNRQIPRVKKLVEEKEWPFEVYLDEEGEVRTALNVVNIPHTFVLDGEGNVVYQSTAYSPGDENILYQKVKEVSDD